MTDKLRKMSTVTVEQIFNFKSATFSRISELKEDNKKLTQDNNKNALALCEAAKHADKQHLKIIDLQYALAKGVK